jgi:Kdo2-lipid IVA lauroyltransferase/acyltransferase
MTDDPKPPRKPKRIKPKRVYSDKYSDHLKPRYWLTWLGLACMYIIAHLPYRLSMVIGKLTGYLLYFFGHSRRRITTVNIGLCFPELSESEQKQLIKQTTIDSGVGFAEMCISWFNHQRINPEMIEIQGGQNLLNAAAEGRGVILVGAHYTTLDLGGVLVAQSHPVGVMYRSNKNPLFDLVLRNSRGKFCDTIIERGDMRAVIRYIKKGGVMWYAPDQDYGPKQAVFAPFFGIEAATITVIPRLVKVNQSPVLILGHHRKPDSSGYMLSISEPVVDFPTGDDRADATRINGLLEGEIRKYPEQYMWLHRRFKTRPEGEEKVYPKKR